MTKEILLPVNSNMKQVDELKQQLMIEAQTGLGVIFDASNVQCISTPLIQLLLISKENFQKNSISFQIKNPSGNFIEILKDFGCFDAFEGVIQ